MSSTSSATRCFSRMITMSDAVQVAAATSSSSTGDVAVFELPSTRIGGRPTPSPSNSRPRNQRTVTSAAREGATSVTAPRRQADEDAVMAKRVHAVVLDQPVERGAIMQLEPEDRVQPDAGAVGVGAAVFTTRDAHSAADVRRRDFVVVGEAPQHFHVADVRVGPVEHADLGVATSSSSVKRHSTSMLPTYVLG